MEATGPGGQWNERPILQSAIYNEPRTVTPSPTFWRAFTFFLVLIAIVFGISTLIEKNRIERISNLLYYGVAVEARVIDKGAKGDESPTYHLDYRFMLDGKSWHGRDTLSLRAWDEIERGQTIGVTAWIGDPKVSQIGTPRTRTLQRAIRTLYGRNRTILIVGSLILIALCLGHLSQRRFLAAATIYPGSVRNLKLDSDGALEKIDVVYGPRQEWTAEFSVTTSPDRLKYRLGAPLLVAQSENGETKLVREQRLVQIIPVGS